MVEFLLVAVIFVLGLLTGSLCVDQYPDNFKVAAIACEEIQSDIKSFDWRIVTCENEVELDYKAMERARKERQDKESVK